MLDHDRFHRGFSRFDLEAELILQRIEDRRVEIDPPVGGYGNMETDVVSTGEARLVEDSASEMHLKEVCQLRDGNVRLIHRHCI